MIEEPRAAFERLVSKLLKKDRSFFERDEKGDYIELTVKSLWLGWQLHDYVMVQKREYILDAVLTGQINTGADATLDHAVKTAQELAGLETEPVKKTCSCRYSDSWRCAKDLGLRTVHCGCACHKQPRS